MKERTTVNINNSRMIPAMINTVYKKERAIFQTE
jgi:hypothetical protein